MQDAKEEVRSRINIEDVIGEYVQLKRAGRNFKGLSPFTGEKTASFFVSPDKNIWHDFSSNKGGDVFAFIMEVEGMDFRQALEHLARRAGVDLSQYEGGASKEFAKRRKRSLEANDLATKYYHQSLLRNQHAMEYVFKTRGLSRQVVVDFSIGYAPDTGSALMSALARKNFTKKELADAGLANRYGGDMFRGRMMLPLMDAVGQTVGFTGRIIGDVEGAPKYLNTPQTVLYNKSQHVFGLSQAKQAIREKDFVVVVEGNLDVVSSHQAGVRQTVATAGTAMTEHHLKALRRLTHDIRLAYDGDKAGIAATERAIFIAEKEEIKLSIVTLPDDAKDPDELIQKNKSAWTECIENAAPALDWLLNQYAKRINLDTADGKRRFVKVAYNLLNKLEDRATVRHYGDVVAKMTGFSYEEVLGMIERDDVDKVVELIDEEPVVQESKQFEENKYRYEDDALAVAIVDGQSQELFEHADISILHGDARQALARYFAKNSGKPLDDTPPELQKYDNYVKMVLLRADARYAEWDSNDRYYETARLLRQIEQEHKKTKRSELTNQLRNAERSGDEAKAMDLRIELKDLIKEIARGRR